MKRWFAALFLLAGLAGFLHQPALAGDATAGRKKAGLCAPCHGRNGIAKLPTAPHIAGESILYLKKQLKAFRSGERKHQQMSIIARGLSDEDIDNLAAWYSAIKITATTPF